MSAADPIAWVAMENALALWVRSSTAIPGDRVRVPATRDEGEAKGPAPKATIMMVGAPVPLQLRGESRIPRSMRQRYTVAADGPGEVGVDFYDGFSTTPQRISITAGIGDPPAMSATALLAELTADLPAGYAASADPEDTASVLVDGSDDEPLFESVSADLALLTVVTAIPRHIVLLKILHNIVWRISFRSNSVSGSTMSANSMAQCQVMRASYLDPAMRRLGFEAAGTALTTSTIAPDRRNSTAELDVRFRGPMTGAQASQAMRRAGVTLAAA